MDKLPLFQLPNQHPPIPEGEEDLCRALWLAVIIQAVMEAKSNRTRKCYRQYREEALEWINGTGSRSDFDEVCTLAGVSASKMRKSIQQAMAGEHDGFNFRCLMKHSEAFRRSSPESRSSYFRRMRRKDECHLKKRQDRDQKSETESPAIH